MYRARVFLYLRNKNQNVSMYLCKINKQRAVNLRKNKQQRASHSLTHRVVESRGGMGTSSILQRHQQQQQNLSTYMEYTAADEQHSRVQLQQDQQLQQQLQQQQQQQQVVYVEQTYEGMRISMDSISSYSTTL